MPRPEHAPSRSEPAFRGALGACPQPVIAASILLVQQGACCPAGAHPWHCRYQCPLTHPGKQHAALGTPCPCNRAAHQAGTLTACNAKYSLAAATHAISRSLSPAKCQCVTACSQSRRHEEFLSSSHTSTLRQAHAYCIMYGTYAIPELRECPPPPPRSPS